MMHLTTNLLTQLTRQALVLTGIFMILSAFLSPAAQAQATSQALSPAELQQINNQPVAPEVSASGVTNTPGTRKPSFQHKEATGTEVTEYKDANSPTQVQVKTKYTTYEMSPPDSVKPGPPSGEGDLLSVPSISIPF